MGELVWTLALDVLSSVKLICTHLRSIEPMQVVGRQTVPRC